MNFSLQISLALCLVALVCCQDDNSTQLPESGDPSVKSSTTTSTEAPDEKSDPASSTDLHFKEESEVHTNETSNKEAEGNSAETSLDKSALNNDTTNAPSMNSGTGDAKTTSPSMANGTGDAKTTTPSMSNGTGDAKTTTPSMSNGTGDAKTTTPSMSNGTGDIKTTTPSMSNGTGDAKTTTPSMNNDTDVSGTTEYEGVWDMWNLVFPPGGENINTSITDIGKSTSTEAKPSSTTVGNSISGGDKGASTHEGRGGGSRSSTATKAVVGVLVPCAVLAGVVIIVIMYRRKSRKSRGYETLEEFSYGLQNPTYDIDL